MKKYTRQFCSGIIIIYIFIIYYIYYNIINGNIVNIIFIYIDITYTGILIILRKVEYRVTSLMQKIFFDIFWRKILL